MKAQNPVKFLVYKYLTNLFLIISKDKDMNFGFLPTKETGWINFQFTHEKCK